MVSPDDDVLYIISSHTKFKCNLIKFKIHYLDKCFSLKVVTCLTNALMINKTKQNPSETRENKRYTDLLNCTNFIEWTFPIAAKKQ